MEPQKTIRKPINLRKGARRILIPPSTTWSEIVITPEKKLGRVWAETPPESQFGKAGDVDAPADPAPPAV